MITVKIGENTARLWVRKEWEKVEHPHALQQTSYAALHTYFCTLIWDTLISKVGPGDLNLLSPDPFVLHTVTAHP